MLGQRAGNGSCRAVGADGKKELESSVSNGAAGAVGQWVHRIIYVFTSGSCLLVYKDYLQKGEGGAVNES